MRLVELRIHPVKSCRPLVVEEAEVHAKGLMHDRRWAIVDDSDRIITGRDHPALLAITAKPMGQGGGIALEHNSHTLEIPEQAFEPGLSPVNLWKEEGHPASKATGKVNPWLSDILGKPVSLIFMRPEHHRALPEEVPSGYRGRSEDGVSYADDFPILLTSKASLAALNTHLSEPVRMDHFRPNLVIDGDRPFEEEEWKYVTVGDCEFEVAQACPRCVFTTVDPETGQKRPDQEPLRTLAKLRNRPGYGVPFGLQLVPRRLGGIHTGDQVSVSRN